LTAALKALRRLATERFADAFGVYVDEPCHLERDAFTVRLHDRETDFVFRFQVEPRWLGYGGVAGAAGERVVRALFDDKELQIRQYTFYVHHCREVLRAVQQDRHEAYMRELLAQPAEAQA
jgi:hypothetical protein